MVKMDVMTLEAFSLILGKEGKICAAYTSKTSTLAILFVIKS